MMNRAGKTSNLSSGSVNRAPGARNPSSGSMNWVPGAGDWGSELRVVEYGRSGAHRNMAFDLHLFNLCEKGNQTGFLRLYGWSRPALSLGFFEPLGVVDTAKAIADGVEIVRRPTGGRAVLHGDDLTYTVVIPKSADHKVLGLYRTISESIISGMARLGVDLDLERGTLGRSRLRNRPCFVSVSRYEIAHSGRKVVGSAQRVGRNAILQHGSIPLGGGYLNVVEYMNLPSRDRRQLRREIEASTCCVSELLGRRVTPEEVAAALVRGFVGGSEVPVARIAADRFDSEVVPLSVTLQEGFRPPQV